MLSVAFCGSSARAGEQWRQGKAQCPGALPALLGVAFAVGAVLRVIRPHSSRAAKPRRKVALAMSWARIDSCIWEGNAVL
jgi:hypothetical protein